jgi:RimJ/RimL family protein N-acetyltransferase
MFPDLTRDDVFRIETKRLWLRWPRMQDAAAIQRLAGVKDVAEMTGTVPHPYPKGEAERFIFAARKGNATGQSLQLAIAPRNAPDKFVGLIGARMKAVDQADMGYWIGEPHWSKGYATEAAQALVDAIFNQRWLLTFILDKFATADNVRSALQRSVYVNPECVTDDLVDDYLSLATDKEAAVEVLRQIYTNDGGPLPFDAADALPDDLPILVVWGDTDNLAPITGPVGRYFRQRAQALPATRFEEIYAGHVPQDDSPEKTNAILREWLAGV